MRKRVLTAVIGYVLTGSVATSAYAADSPDKNDLKADEAFVLVNMGTRGILKQYVASIQFGNGTTDLGLTVPREKGFQVIKVKAGTYQPEALGLSYKQEHRRLTHFVDRKADQRAIVVEPGTVTYIGQWDVLYGKSTTLLGKTIVSKDSAYKVSYPITKVNSFAQENQWITQFPLRFSHISGQNVATSWQHIEQEQYN